MPHVAASLEGWDLAFFTFFAVGKFYPGKTFLCAGEDELPTRKTTKKKGKK